MLTEYGTARTTARKRGAGGVAEFLKAQQLATEDRALAVAQRLAAEVDRYQREKFGETAAERAFLASIHASCVTPVGVKATSRDDELAMRAILFSADGARHLAEEASEPCKAGDSLAATRIGEKLGVKMISRGARELLDGI